MQVTIFSSRLTTHGSCETIDAISEFTITFPFFFIWCNINLSTQASMSAHMWIFETGLQRVCGFRACKTSETERTDTYFTERAIDRGCSDVEGWSKREDGAKPSICTVQTADDCGHDMLSIESCRRDVYERFVRCERMFTRWCCTMCSIKMKLRT